MGFKDQLHLIRDGVTHALPALAAGTRESGKKETPKHANCALLGELQRQLVEFGLEDNMEQAISVAYVVQGFTKTKSGSNPANRARTDGPILFRNRINARRQHRGSM